MNKVLINGENFKNELDVHQFLKSNMSLPDYYGDNLDALWDLLGEVTEPTEIVIKDVHEFIDNLGDCAKDFIYLFDDAQRENEFINFKIL